MNWIWRGRLAGLMLLAVSFVAANAGTDPTGRTPGPDDTAARLDRASAEARLSLPDFLALVINRRGIASEAAVKVAMPTPEGGTEEIWITPFGIRDGDLVGLLATQPEHLHGRLRYDTVVFRRDQVRDWSYIGGDGRIYGSFAARALVADLGLPRNAAMRRLLSDSPLPVTR